MTVQLLTGDCRDILPTLPERSIQCCVTSPPYHGLRDYGTARWEGGDPECDHRKVQDTVAAVATSTLGGGKKTTGHQQEGYRGQCGRCGAVRIDKGIGLEPTIDEHITALVEVFRGVWRVLKDDGTVWLNYGDAYAGSGKGAWDRTDVQKEVYVPKPGGPETQVQKVPNGLKPKDLIGLPWRIAFALQAEGWYLRSAIVWHKPNPMPESVTDRPTSAYENIFLLTKSGRYYYDASAIREECTPESLRTSAYRLNLANGKGVDQSRQDYHTLDRFASPAGRNARNVWTIATAGFSDAHFAVFPPEIPRRCILAGTSDKGQCPACGAPWVRVVERFVPPRGMYEDDPARIAAIAAGGGKHAGIPGGRKLRQWQAEHGGSQTTGWQPSCTCSAGDPVPQTVLDPFAGAGTTLLVADRLGRNAVGIEVNPEYVAMAQRRITNDAPLFVDLETA